MRIGSAISLMLMATTLSAAVHAQRAPLPGDIALKEDSAAQRGAKWTLPDGPGTGPYPAVKSIDPAFPDRVVYHPRNIAKVGKPLPVLLWANGGCRADGASARLVLEEIASHGYLVIAPGKILSGPEIPMPEKDPDFGKTTLTDVLAGIDLVTKVNSGATPYHGKLDLQRIAVAGTSCGGLQALQAAADPRIKAVIGFHTGFFNDDRAPDTGMPTSKALLSAIHVPILYVLGGPRDIAYVNGMDDFEHINHVPVFIADHAVGHLGTFNQANGGSEAKVALGWLQWQLYGDAKGKAMFVGEDCTLCKDGSWALKRKNLGQL